LSLPLSGEKKTSHCYRWLLSDRLRSCIVGHRWSFSSCAVWKWASLTARCWIMALNLYAKPDPVSACRWHWRRKFAAVTLLQPVHCDCVYDLVTLLITWSTVCDACWLQSSGFVHRVAQKIRPVFVCVTSIAWHSGRTSVFDRTGELSLSCTRPTADGWPLMWVNRPL